VQFEHLGSVEEAVAAIEHELLLRVAPARERFGPRVAPGQVEQFCAASITVQYASPVTSGESSRASIDAIASSSSAIPSAISPR
jgi:hypothetical protein